MTEKRFKIYDISSLRGKVPSVFIENYLDDNQNIEIISFIGGLLRTCGNYDLSIKISEEIISKAQLGKDNLFETSIAVWNLYVLSKIYIEEENFDKAYRSLDVAERYWTKDLILADTTEICRVRNKEDLWIRRAFAYLVQGRVNEFEKTIDKVLLSRYALYKNAYDVTKETPIRDPCLLDCFEYSSYMYRNMEDLKRALIFVKTAIRYLGKIPIDNDYYEGKLSEKKGDYKNAYTYYLKFYLTSRPQIVYKSLVYGTCKSCAYFETCDENDGLCKRINLPVNQYKACESFLPMQLE